MALMYQSSYVTVQVHKWPTCAGAWRAAAGLPSVGTHVLSTWPTITELVGQTKQFDYVEFVAEYASWTMHDLDNPGRAVELFPDFTGMVKIEQDTRGHLAMRAIGSGLQNIIFADVRTVEDACASGRYEPSTPSTWAVTESA